MKNRKVILRDPVAVEIVTEVRREEALLKANTIREFLRRRHDIHANAIHSRNLADDVPRACFKKSERNECNPPKLARNRLVLWLVTNSSLPKDSPIAQARAFSSLLELRPKISTKPCASPMTRSFAEPEWKGWDGNGSRLLISPKEELQK